MMVTWKMAMTVLITVALLSVVMEYIIKVSRNAMMVIQVKKMAV